MLSSENKIRLASVSRNIAVDPRILKGFDIITAYLGGTCVLRDCISEIQVVSDEERKGMLKTVEFLQHRLQEIENIQKQQEIEQSDEKEIRALSSELQKIINLLEDMDEQAKHSWYKRMWEQPMIEKFNAMKAMIDSVTKNSTLIATTLNSKLIAALRSELGALRLQYDTLNKEVVSLRKSNTLLLKNDLVTDKSVTPPDPPNIVYITESEGKLLVKWQARSDEIDKYKLCYDEEQNLIKQFLGNIHEATIGPPEFDLVPGKIYTMKVCGVNSGGRGEWSNSVVQKFTKPCPSKPEPPKVCSISASKARITLTTPKLACPTESPVTEWEVEYATLNKSKGCRELLSRKFEVQHPGVNYIMDLTQKQAYCLRARAGNAEGWSSYSKTVEFEMVQSYCACNHLAELIITLLVIILAYIILCF